MKAQAAKAVKDPKNKFEVNLNPNAPLFIISVVSQVVGIPIWTLRKLDQMGVVKPGRIGKKTRCYSHIQIEKLSYVHYLMEEKHVNISGIKIIIEMGGDVGSSVEGKFI